MYLRAANGGLLSVIADGYSSSSNVLASRHSARRIRSVASINFEHVTKRYADGVEAVKDMNLAIADGELMVLVGPSGSGKSTALRMARWPSQSPRAGAWHGWRR